MNEDRMPNFDEYLAGIVLASGIVWIWYFLLSRISLNILRNASFVIYFLSSGIASYLVSLRASKKYFTIGFIVSMISWLVSLPQSLSLTAEPTPSLTLSILTSFIMGGATGSYLALKKKLRLKQAHTLNGPKGK